MLKETLFEKIGKNVYKICSDNNLRAAIFDMKCMSVYLFNGNRRTIATEHIKNKTVIEVLNLCKVWVDNGIFNESDFAA